MRPGAYAAEVLEVKAEQTPGSDVESLILTFPTIFDLISEKKNLMETCGYITMYSVSFLTHFNNFSTYFTT